LEMGNSTNATAKNTQVSQDVWDALESLGYKPSQIQRIISEIDYNLEVSEQIRRALKLLQK